VEVEVGVMVMGQDSGMEPEGHTLGHTLGHILGHIVHGIAYPVH
jgi:hypothetical protein